MWLVEWAEEKGDDENYWHNVKILLFKNKYQFFRRSYISSSIFSISTSFLFRKWLDFNRKLMSLSNSDSLTLKKSNSLFGLLGASSDLSSIILEALTKNFSFHYCNFSLPYAFFPKEEVTCLSRVKANSSKELVLQELWTDWWKFVLDSDESLTFLFFFTFSTVLSMISLGLLGVEILPKLLCISLLNFKFAWTFGLVSLWNAFLINIFKGFIFSDFSDFGLSFFFH